MLLDAHTHAFSEKIAKKAVEQLINYYQMPTEYGGSLPELLAHAAEARLDALVLLVAATRAEQVKPAHDWILAQPWRDIPDCPRIIPFGTYHIDDPHWQQEIARLRAAGVIRGIKLHPEFQGIDLADPRLHSLLEEIAGDFVLMVHVGDPRKSENNLARRVKSPRCSISSRVSPSSPRIWAGTVFGKKRMTCWPGANSTWIPRARCNSSIRHCSAAWWINTAPSASSAVVIIH